MLKVEKTSLTKGKTLYHQYFKGFCPVCGLKKYRMVILFTDTDETAFACSECNTVWGIESACYIF